MKMLSKILFLIFFVSVCYTSSAQTINKTTKMKYAKMLAFDYCIYTNYKSLDSNYALKFKDASGLLFSINGGFTEKIRNTITNYTMTKTGNYFSAGSNLQDNSKNIVICNCLSYYESADLKKFLEKLFL